jgi:putative membrane protein
MAGLFVRWLILTVAIMSASYMLEGIHVDNFFSAFFAAAILGILNALFRPVLIILTLPINILSLGLFTFVINAIMLKMASGVIEGFYVYGFWTAIFGSLIISIVNGILSALIPGRPGSGGGGTGNYIDLEKKNGGRWE